LLLLLLLVELPARSEPPRRCPASSCTAGRRSCCGPIAGVLRCRGSFLVVGGSGGALRAVCGFLWYAATASACCTLKQRPPHPSPPSSHPRWVCIADKVADHLDGAAQVVKLDERLHGCSVCGRIGWLGQRWLLYSLLLLLPLTIVLGQSQLTGRTHPPGSPSALAPVPSA